MKKLIIGLYSFFCLGGLRLRGMKLPFSSYIGTGKHIKGANHITIGKNTRIRHHASLLCYSANNQQQLTPSLIIGSNVYINSGFKALVAAKLVIEDNVTIANDVSVITENHGLDASTASYLDNDLQVKDVIIHQGAWIGENAILLPGVTIGKKSIVGAGSIVTKDIPDYAMAVGNPARVIKKYNPTTKTWEKLA
jgi:acetyltransferase-like isoleucine patch superfamily enzyme